MFKSYLVRLTHHRYALFSSQDRANLITMGFEVQLDDDTAYVHVGALSADDAADNATRSLFVTLNPGVDPNGDDLNHCDTCNDGEYEVAAFPD